MFYVYIIVSMDSPDRHYCGVTGDLRKRLDSHNAGEVTHTTKFAPWRLKNYIAFNDHPKALAFEKYLKSGSGRAFAKRHF